MGSVDDANAPLEQPQFTPVAARDEENKGKDHEDDDSQGDRIGSSAVTDDTENKSDGELHEQLINGGGSDLEDEKIFDETREKLRIIRVKFLRLVHRLGLTPDFAHVLYRIGLSETLTMNTSRADAFNFDIVSAMAEQLEAAGQEPLDFSCTIMLIGKTGVGKTATINSIFDKETFNTNSLPGTTKVQEINGNVQGVKLRIIDTPGLSPSSSDQPKNERILHSIKHFIEKSPPDVIMYVDRFDVQNTELGDVPLLRTITEVLGPSIWFDTMVVLTHAGSAPDCPNGVPLSYEMYATERSHVIQQAVPPVVLTQNTEHGDVRLLHTITEVLGPTIWFDTMFPTHDGSAPPDGPNGVPSSYAMYATEREHVIQQAVHQAVGHSRLCNPFSLVENHSACWLNKVGSVVPNYHICKPYLLLLSFAFKILTEAKNTLLKFEDSKAGRPLFFESFLQSRAQLKMPEEQFVDDDTLYNEFVKYYRKCVISAWEQYNKVICTR